MNTETEPEKLVLDWYQEPWYEKIKAEKRILLGAEMGLGKTPPTIKAIVDLNLDSVLIIGTRRTIMGWLRMMRRWYPEYLKKFAIILSKGGNQAFRASLWDKAYPFVITTFQIWHRDRQYIKRINYSFVAADELHKFMRSFVGKKMTETFKHLKELAQSCIYLVLITGSPVLGNNGAEWWGYLHLIDRKRYSSYWRFAATFAHIIDLPFGKDIVGVRNAEGLHSLQRRHMVLVLKKDVGKQKKRRSFLYAEMEPAVEKLYWKILDDMMYWDPEKQQYVFAANQAIAQVRARQLLVCPEIVQKGLGIGAGAKAVLEELTPLPREQRHCVIYTPYVDPIPILHDHIVKLGIVEDNVYDFSGGLDIGGLEERLDAWRKSKGIALMSILYAESFDMETTDKGFFLGYMRDPQQNKQAEDRVDRANNMHNLINMYYVFHEDTLDEVGMERLVLRQQTIDQLYADPVRLRIQMDQLKRSRMNVGLKDFGGLT